MSKELIKAAGAGNLEEVKRLLALKGTDIYFTLVEHDTYTNTKTIYTAFGEAIKEKKWAVVEELLNHINVLIKPKSAIYSKEEIYNNPYLFFFYFERYPPTTLFKECLLKSPSINPKFKAAAETPIELFIKYEVYGYFPLMYHEAILRNDCQTINAINKSKVVITINVATMAEYIQGRDISTQDALLASNAIDYIIREKLITNELGDNLKSLITSNVKFELKLDAFPSPLKVHLAKSSSRKVHELYCEFVRWIYPEYRLSQLSIDSEIYQKTSHDECVLSKEQIQAIQNPVNLRTFLNDDVDEIIVSLYVATDQYGGNPAALLLAELILHHGEKNIRVDGKDEVYLDKKQQEKGVKVLQRLYNLTQFERLVLTTNRRLTQRIIGLEKEFAEFKNTTEEKLDLVLKKLDEKKHHKSKRGNSAGLFDQTPPVSQLKK